MEHLRVRVWVELALPPHPHRDLRQLKLTALFARPLCARLGRLSTFVLQSSFLVTPTYSTLYPWVRYHSLRDLSVKTQSDI